MAKHKLKIVPGGMSFMGEPVVTFKCEKCPKFVNFESYALYMILVEGDDRLSKSERVKKWSVCNG